MSAFKWKTLQASNKHTDLNQSTFLYKLCMANALDPGRAINFPNGPPISW